MKEASKEPGRTRKPKPFHQRFWNKVDVRGPTECWLWNAGKHVFGYGKITVKKGYSEHAHRLVWMFVHGQIPEGMGVLHNCPSGDNPACCNPDHLFLGPPEANRLDMIAKGRMGRGHKMGPKDRRLSEALVIEIRLLAKHGSMSGGDLSRLFGYNQNEINRILKGKAYAWVKGEERADEPVRKFSPAEVREMRRWRYAEGVSVTEIARRKDILPAQVSVITRGKSYAWVD